MIRLVCYSTILLILLPSFSFAEIKTIYVSHKYIMGDNDSKNDARHICFLEAKRKALSDLPIPYIALGSIFMLIFNTIGINIDKLS
jgi:hypothetical protein